MLPGPYPTRVAAMALLVLVLATTGPGTAVHGSSPAVCLRGMNAPGGDLPGMPLPGAKEGGPEACAAACTATEACNLFVFHAPACNARCHLATGCCWLKANETVLSPTVDYCACTGYVRVPKTAFTPPRQPPPNAPNVLHLIVDDMRPELQAYGQNYTVNPTIAALAARSLVFRNAYCQISVCSPSRMSFLTSRRPDTSKIYNFIDHFRQADCGIPKAHVAVAGAAVLQSLPVPVGMGGSGQCCSSCSEVVACEAWSYFAHNGTCLLFGAAGAAVSSMGTVSGASGTFATHAQWTSLPQNFKNNGFLVAGTGKVFHTEEGGVGNLDPTMNGPGMPPNEDPPSWSTPSLSMQHVNGVAPMNPCHHETSQPSICPIAATLNGTLTGPGPQLCDKVVADDAIVKLRLAAKNRQERGQPFYLAVGFRKPHLPFRFPRPWLDRFPPLAETVTAKHPTQDRSIPAIAHHDDSPQASPYVAVNHTVAQEWRRAYMAALAWMDSQMGRVLDELDALGLANDTVIVLHSDHGQVGWSLGEHGGWQKFTNFEMGTRVPLIIHSPAHPASFGKQTGALAELLDVFPTLNALAGIPPPPGEALDGQSLVPAIENPAQPTRPMRPYALSQYMRCPANTSDPALFWKSNACLMTDRTLLPFMGYTLRTDTWRYTEWARWNGSSLRPIWAQNEGVELYTHDGDDGTDFDAFENTNQAEAHPDVVRQLSVELHAIVGA